ncbi:MAG: acyl-[acyl-carrier-protein] thioesterase [Bacilli bacterium]
MLSKTEEYTITTNQLDRYDHVTVASALDICQSIAGHHADDLGIGYNDFIKDNKIWLIIGSKMTYLKYPKSPNKLKIITYPLKPNSFHSERDYYIYDENDELIIKCTSKWVIYDFAKKRINICSNIMPNEEFIESRAYDEQLSKMNMGQLDEYKKVLTHEVAFTDLDHNGHFNNTRYCNLFYDIHPLKENELIKEIQVDYINQCFIGDKLDVFVKEFENEYYLIGKVDTNLVFSLKVVLDR